MREFHIIEELCKNSSLDLRKSITFYLVVKQEKCSAASYTYLRHTVLTIHRIDHYAELHPNGR